MINDEANLLWVAYIEYHPDAPRGRMRRASEGNDLIVLQ